MKIANSRKLDDVYSETNIACPSCVFSASYNLSPEYEIGEFDVYTFFDLIGDIGGVIDILIALFGWMFFQLSEFSYTLKFLEKLFLAKTK